jgi:hypothetical protein
VAYPDEVWRQRAEEGPTSANFIARERGVDVGLAAVFAEPDAPGHMHLPSNPARTESLLRLSLGGSLQTPGQQVPGPCRRRPTLAEIADEEGDI